jgi:hypothetical protein
MNKLWKRVALVLICQNAQAVENNLPVINAIPAIVNEGETFSLLLAGTAPTSCGFQMDKPIVSGSDITINLRALPRICAQVLTPFRQPISVFESGATAKAGVYRVRVNYMAIVEGDMLQNRLLAFALVPVRKTGNADVRPETGNWNFERGGQYATSGSGVSFNIEAQGDVMVATTNFYTDKGDPVWYFQSGTVAGGVHSAQAVLVGGGQTLFGAYKPPARIENFANIAFEFSSPTQGTAWVSQPIGSGLFDGLKMMPISISRFNYGFGIASNALKGEWILVSDVKNGTDTQHLSLSSQVTGSNVLARLTSGEFTVNCALDARTPESLPDGCVLLRSGVQVATFTQLGYNRLRGVDPNGKPVSMFRVE